VRILCRVGCADVIRKGIDFNRSFYCPLNQKEFLGVLNCPSVVHRIRENGDTVAGQDFCLSEL
jgi:hypothetical protein